MIFLNGCYGRYDRLSTSVLIHESPAVVWEVCSYTTGETVLEIQFPRFSWVHKKFYFSKWTVGENERIDFIWYPCLARINVKNPILFDIPHKMADNGNMFPCPFFSLSQSNKLLLYITAINRAPVNSQGNIFSVKATWNTRSQTRTVMVASSVKTHKKSLSADSKTSPWKHWSRCSSFSHIKISDDTMLIALNSFQ